MRLELMGAALGLAAIGLGDGWSGPAGAAAFAPGDQLEQPLAQAGQSPWFLGGRLHDVAAPVWMAASPDNQLATAADWAMAFPDIEARVSSDGDMNALLPYATALRACVSQAASDEVAEGRQTPTAELAAVCAVLLQWVAPES